MLIVLCDRSTYVISRARSRLYVCITEVKKQGMSFGKVSGGGRGFREANAVRGCVSNGANE